LKITHTQRLTNGLCRAYLPANKIEALINPFSNIERIKMPVTQAATNSEILWKQQKWLENTSLLPNTHNRVCVLADPYLWARI